MSFTCVIFKLSVRQLEKSTVGQFADHQPHSYHRFMPAKPLSPDQSADAARLKALFIAWQQERKRSHLPSSQEWCSDQLGFGQSAVTQYLNGKIPLNLDAASRFAELLQVQVEEFSPAMAALTDRFFERIKIIGNGRGEAGSERISHHILKTHLRYIAQLIWRADPAARETIAGILGGLAKNPKSYAIVATALLALCGAGEPNGPNKRSQDIDEP